MKTPKEYYTCHVTGQTLHYTEFVLAKSGWLAIDNTYRHPISKEGKRINQSLLNALRQYVNGKLVAISHELHPFHKLYQKHKESVCKENNYNPTAWLRADLTKEVYFRVYKELNLNLPNFDNLNKRNSRKSNGSDACLEYLNIPNDREHREVRIGKYFVDGLINQTVIEYFGDYFHANPRFYQPNDKVLKETAEKRWERDEKRLNTIREKGYDIIKIWENDWHRFTQKMTPYLRIERNGIEYHIENIEKDRYLVGLCGG